MNRATILPVLCTLAALAGQALGEDGPQAGRDAKGFFLGQDETKLYLGGFMQTRYMANFRDNAGDNQDLTQGFSIRRARLIFQGNLNKQYSFKLEFDKSSTEDFKTMDASLTYKPDASWQVRMGQFKLPLLKEELVSDTNQLTVERSTVNSVFTGARSQGVEAQYADKTWRAFAMLSDGLNALNTDFTSASESDFALTGRAEFLWAGEDFKRFDNFSGTKGKPYTGMVGAALHYQDGGETAGTTDESRFVYTLDVGAKGDPWSVYAAIIGRTIDPAGGTSFDDFGWLVQGGYYVSDNVELFARLSQVIPDSDRASGEDFMEATIGAACYPIPESNALKFTADLTWTFNDQAGSSSIVRPSAANGLLASSEDDQVYFRLQGQFVF